MHFWLFEMAILHRKISSFIPFSRHRMISFPWKLSHFSFNYLLQHLFLAYTNISSSEIYLKIIGMKPTIVARIQEILYTIRIRIHMYLHLPLQREIRKMREYCTSGNRSSDHRSWKFRRAGTWLPCSLVGYARNYTPRTTRRLIVHPVKRGHRDLTLVAPPFPRGNEKGCRESFPGRSQIAVRPLRRPIGRSAASEFAALINPDIIGYVPVAARVITYESF